MGHSLTELERNVAIPVLPHPNVTGTPVSKQSPFSSSLEIDPLGPGKCCAFPGVSKEEQSHWPKRSVEMRKYSLAAGAISATLVGGALWFARLDHDAWTAKIAHTPGPSFSSGKSEKTKAFRSVSSAIEVDDSLPGHDSPSKAGRANARPRSETQHPEEANRSGVARSNESDTVAVNRHGRQETPLAAGGLPQLMSPSTDGGASGIEPQFAKFGHVLPPRSSEDTRLDISTQNHVRKTRLFGGIEQQGVFMLVSPEVLSQVADMSPEQIEAYTYLAGLLLNPQLVGGPVPEGTRRKTDSKPSNSIPSKPVPVSATESYPLSEIRRGWTAFEFSDGSAGLILDGDDATVLGVEAGTVVGPYGRVQDISRTGNEVAVLFENGDRIAGRAELLRFRDPLPRASGKVRTIPRLSASQENPLEGELP